MPSEPNVLKRVCIWLCFKRNPLVDTKNAGRFESYKYSGRLQVCARSFNAHAAPMHSSSSIRGGNVTVTVQPSALPHPYPLGPPVGIKNARGRIIISSTVPSIELRVLLLVRKTTYVGEMLKATRIATDLEPGMRARTTSIFMLCCLTFSRKNKRETERIARIIK